MIVYFVFGILVGALLTVGGVLLGWKKMNPRTEPQELTEEEKNFQTQWENMQRYEGRAQ